MTPFDKLIYAHEGITLKEANNIIWDHKLNSLPVIDDAGHLTHLVFRKDRRTAPIIHIPERFRRISIPQIRLNIIRILRN